MLNTRASTDARHSRSGADSILYDEDGNALAGRQLSNEIEF